MFFFKYAIRTFTHEITWWTHTSPPLWNSHADESFYVRLYSVFSITLSSLLKHQKPLKKWYRKSNFVDFLHFSERQQFNKSNQNNARMSNSLKMCECFDDTHAFTQQHIYLILANLHAIALAITFNWTKRTEILYLCVDKFVGALKACLKKHRQTAVTLSKVYAYVCVCIKLVGTRECWNVLNSWPRI